MRKFHRVRGRRKLFLNNLAHNLIAHEKIETTVPRAKEIRSVVERFITIAKKQNVASFRRLLGRLPKKSAEKLYYDIAPRYKDRNGGYTRITKQLKSRKRDGTQTAIIEFIK